LGFCWPLKQLASDSVNIKANATINDFISVYLEIQMYKMNTVTFFINYLN
jgi:hypothetical protein